MNRSGVKALLGLCACATLLGMATQTAFAQDADMPRAISAPQKATPPKPQAATATPKPQSGAAPARQATAGIAASGVAASQDATGAKPQAAVPMTRTAAAPAQNGTAAKPQAAAAKPQAAAAKPTVAAAQPAAAAAEAGSNPAPAGADAASEAPHAAPKPAAPAKPYFIEFRARSAQSYGHTFAVHGRVGQKLTPQQVVGLHPMSESPIPWMIGHLVLVPSETGASDGDIEDQYIIARYRILLSEPEYKKVLAQMKKMQASSPVWHAVLYNCNAFVGDIAKFMGLKTPGSTMLMPKEYINTLKSLNATPRQASAPAGAVVR